MKKKIVIPKGLLIPDISHAGILGLDTYMAAPEKIKKEPKKAVEPTLKELKLKCALRNLSQAGTKKVLSQRIKADDEKVREDKIFAAQEENRIIREHKEREIKVKERQMKVIRKQVQTAYTELAKQQTVCNQLDELANKLRINIAILKE
jgi:hypothetical protein